MALGTGIGDVLPLHTSQQQGKKLHINNTNSTSGPDKTPPNHTGELDLVPSVSRRRRGKNSDTAASLLFDDDDPWDQNDHEANLALSAITSTRHRGISPSTAYTADTDVMVRSSFFFLPSNPCERQIKSNTTQEVTYNQPRDIVHDPLYNAHNLAPTITALSAPRTSSAKTTTTTQQPTPSSNPFALAPSALPTWHHARTDLSNPTHFYTKMLDHYPSPDDPRPEPEERFAVQVLESTLEIEQGLADLRGLLKECHRMEDEEALEGLRVRIGWALEGMR